MKLYYRGVSYEYNPTKAQNRKTGQTFKQARESRPAYDLIYRRFTYRVDPDAKPAEVPTLPATYKLSIGE